MQICKYMYTLYVHSGQISFNKKQSKTILDMKRCFLLHNDKEFRFTHPARGLLLSHQIRYYRSSSNTVWNQFSDSAPTGILVQIQTTLSLLHSISDVEKRWYQKTEGRGAQMAENLFQPYCDLTGIFLFETLFYEKLVNN